MAQWSAEQKAEAVAMAEDGVTLAEAHERTGIPKSTLSGWATFERSTEKTAAATAERLATIDARRAALASALLDDVDELRRQLFAPCLEKRAVVVGQGRDEPSLVEVVEIERDQPTFSEQTKIMTSVAIGVDKVQLLTGEATERHEHRATERTPEQEAELGQVLELVRPSAA